MSFFGFFSRADNIISVSLNQNKITCLWAEKSIIKSNNANNKTNNKILIKSYETIKLDNLEFFNATIFNQTKICKIIKDFITKNKIYKPKIALSIAGAGIFEKVITLSNASPSKEDLLFIKTDACKESLENQEFINQKHMQIDWIHLSQNVNQELNPAQNFYFCAISNEKIFQYKLLAKNAKSNLVGITTENASIIALYKYCFEKNFSQTKLSMTLQENNFDFRKLLYKEKIREFIGFKKNLNINLDHEFENICIGAGLFLIGEKT